MKPVLQLSAAQNRAVTEKSKKVLVEAAAGSGKTTVIVEKFAAAVLGGVATDRIACITYTEQAACHLKSKLAERFEEAGLENQLEKLTDAYVSTIHGFCRRFLKEFAIDAGVDPAFGVLDGDVASLLRSEAAARAFEKVSAQDETRKLLEDFAVEDIEKSVTKLYGRWRSSPGMPHVLGRAPDFASLIDAAQSAWSAAGCEGQPELPDFAEAVLGGPLTDRAFEILSRAWGAAGSASGKRKEAVREYQQTIDALAGELADAVSEPYASGFEALLSAFHGEYTQAKSERGALDFDDLIRESVEALRRDARLRTRWASAFDLVLVDEYQDVNPLQAELLSLVSGTAQSFYVGDVRQSIYAFRHADCREFVKAARESERVRITLDENRRSVPHVLEFVNGLFDGEVVTEGYPYGKMKAVRKETPDPEVCILAVDRNLSHGQNTDDARRSEARAIAAEIRLLADSGTRLGDVAVLLRSRTALHIYEEALNRAGIRYRVAKGKDFYYKTEIEDVLCALRALDDPRNDLRMAALLKSPLGGISDDALYLLRKRWPEAPLCEAVRAAVAAPENGGGFFEADICAIRRFLEWFDRLASEKRRLAPDCVIARLLAATAYDVVILASEDGVRRHANLRKLQDKAASYAKTEGPDLGRFVRFVEALVFDETEESEASLEDERADAVQIMTVHGAKGLEFGVVFIADMGKDRDGGSRVNGAGFLLTDSLELLAPVPHEYHRQKARGARYRAVKEALDAREKEESHRLFYVALTRAENRIYLCGALRKNADAEEEKSWMDLIESNLPFLRESGDGVWNGVPVRVKRPEAADSTARSGGRPDPAMRLDRLVLAMEAGQEPVVGESVRAAVARILHDDKGYFQTLDLRVTEFLESDLPDTAGAAGARVQPRRAQNHADEGRLPAAEYGTLYHRMLQYADFGETADAQLEKLFETVAPHLDAASRKRMGDGFQKFFESERGLALARVAAQKRPIYRELPFLFRVEGGSMSSGEVGGGKGMRDLGFLSGQADLLYFDDTENGWTLVDYKTGRRSDLHRDQLLIYAHCLGALLGAPIRNAEIFYAEDGMLERVDLAVLEEPGFGEKLSVRYANLREKELGRLRLLSPAGFDMLK